MRKTPEMLYELKLRRMSYPVTAPMRCALLRLQEAENDPRSLRREDGHVYLSSLPGRTIGRGVWRALARRKLVTLTVERYEYEVPRAPFGGVQYGFRKRYGSSWAAKLTPQGAKEVRK